MDNVKKKPIAKREEAANAVLAAIAGTGRQLFFSPANERVARFYLDEFEQAWFVDHLTGMQFAPLTRPWIGCSVGEKGQALIEALEKFIRKGEQVPFAHLQEDWGYGSAMPDLVKQLMKTNVFAKENEHVAA
jgi:hypothetical protein